MKKFYTLLTLLICAMITINAQQSYEKHFTKAADTATFASKPADYEQKYEDDNMLTVYYHQTSGQFTAFMQIWFNTFALKTAPYVKFEASSNVAQTMTVRASYTSVASNVDFGAATFTGGDKLDTIFMEKTPADVAQTVKEFDFQPSEPTCIIKFSYIKIGLIAHPLQCVTPLNVKVLPSAACTLTVKSLYFEKGDPIAKLIPSVTCTSTDITNLAVTDVQADSSCIITFNTANVNKAVMLTFTLKDVGSVYSRDFSIPVNITPKAGGPVEYAASELKIYPNPVGESATVELPVSDGCQLSVVDAAGKVVMTQSVPQGVVKVDLNTSALAAGVYQLMMNGGGSIVSKSFKK